MNILISGCVYVNEKGEEFIYLGKGSIEEYYPSIEYIASSIEDRHIYISMKDIYKCLERGNLSKDWKKLNNTNKQNSLRIMISKEPRLLFGSAKELFPPDYFKNFDLEEHTEHNGHDIYKLWRIRAN